jgi:hypothetical protein
MTGLPFVPSPIPVVVPFNTSNLEMLRRPVESAQYASHDFQRKLNSYGMRCSMSRKGSCWDNAPTESFFNSLKNERVHGTRYRTHREAVADLFEYIEVFYNRSRRHSSLGFISPTQFMQDCWWLSEGCGRITRGLWKAKNREPHFPSASDPDARGWQPGAMRC